MIQLTVNDTNYSCFEDWKEMPLSKAIELATLCNKEMPLPLKSLYELYTKSKGADDTENKSAVEKFILDGTDEDWIKNFPVFYGKAIKCLSDIPQEIIDKTNSDNRNIFYQQYCFKFVFGVLHHPFDFVYNGIEKFEHHGEVLHAPKSKKILGKIKPFADRTAIEFAESADLELYSKNLDGGKFECAANIIAILCRPIILKTVEDIGKKLTKREAKEIKKEDWFKLEPYNEDTCLKRAEGFHDLKMDIVWEVFFCLTQQSILLSQDMALSSMAEAQRILKQEFPAGLMTSDGAGNSLTPH